MQVLLTGATGFVGSELLAQLIARSEVSHITCLARRSLSQTSPKLELLLHDDFARYSSELAARLARHSGCRWAIGGKASDSASPDEFARVTHTFTLSFAHAAAQHLSRPFRFCQLSGMGADPSEIRRSA
jgi:nucleoside-diphosphate-sugar epimerase